MNVLVKRSAATRGAWGIIVATSAATALSTSASGQESLELEPVVVTATGFEQQLGDAPASITVISREELEKGAFRDLTDALREVQGVTVTGVANEKDISIRGLPGKYTLILVDGRRQSTREARTNGSDGYEQSFVPPVSAIERIEVIRGPMSSLYGSDAMGGVINIITRKIEPEWTGSVTVAGTLQNDRDFGDSGQTEVYASGPLAPGLLGLQFWGKGYLRAEDDFEGGVTGAQEGDATARLTLTPTPDHDVILEGGVTRLRRDSEGGKTLADGSADSRQDHDRLHWALSHEGRWGGGFTSKLAFQQEWAERTSYAKDAATGEFVESARSPEIVNSVLDGSVSAPFALGGDHMAVIGGQFQNALLTDQNPGRRTGLDEEFEIEQWAIFAEDEWWLTDSFALTVGLRYDKHQEYEGHFSPRLYGVWKLTDAFTVKGGYSTGFRAPDIRQIAPGYAYTTGGRGCTYGPAGTCGVIVGDPDLEAEKSESYELSAEWDADFGLTAGATLFYTEFEDKIANELVVDGTGTPVRWSEDPNYRLWRSFNVDEATMKGVELSASWRATDALSFRGTYTYTKSEQESGAYKGFPLARTPEHAGSLRVDWRTPVEGLETWALATYHGSETVAGPRIGSNGETVYINGVPGKRYDPYALVDIGASYELADGVTTRAAIYNLFDKTIDQTDYNTVGEGRRLWVSLTTEF